MKRKLPYLLFLLFTAYFTKDIFSWFNQMAGPNDWDQHFFYLEAAIKPLVEYKQFPSWNPWYMGGMSLLANPQIKLFTPTFLFGILLGSVDGLKVSILFYYFLGSIGVYYLFYNALKFRVALALAFACVYMFSGFLPMHLFAGHTTFIGYTMLPLALAFYLKSLQIVHLGASVYKNKWIYLSGLVLALVYLEGGIHLILYSGLCCTIAVFLFSIRDRKKSYMVHFLIVWFVFFLLCAHRIIPLLELYLNQDFRYVADQSFINPSQVWMIFTSAISNPYVKNWETQQYFWWEYGNYIGYLPFVLGGTGIFFVRKRDWPYFILLLILLSLTMGAYQEFSLSKLLQSLPFFDNQRCYARWSSMLLFAGIIFSGQLVCRLDEWIRKVLYSPLRVNLWKVSYAFFWGMIVVFQFYDLQIVNRKVFKDLFHLKIPERTNLQEFKTIRKLPLYGGTSAMYPAIKNNLSTLDGFEILAGQSAALHIDSKDYKGEFYLIKGNKKIKPRLWTPSQISFKLDLKRPDYLVVNQNYSGGWKCRPECHAIMHDGLIAIPLGKGSHEIVLYHYFWYHRLLVYGTGFLFPGLIVWILVPGFRKDNRLYGTLVCN